MSTGNVRLLDGLESSGVEESPRTPVDEEDAPPPPRPPGPPTASNRQTLRHNTAVDLAERCSERLGLIQAVSSSAEFARKVDRGTRRLLYIDQLSQFVASSQVSGGGARPLSSWWSFVFVFGCILLLAAAACTFFKRVCFASHSFPCLPPPLFFRRAFRRFPSPSVSSSAAPSATTSTAL